MVVPCHDSSASECILDRFLSITSTLLNFVSQLIHVIETVICSDNFETDVYIEKDTCLFHDESRVEAGPNFEVVCVEVVGICLVKTLLPDLLKLEAAHHRVEEDLKEIQVVTISLLHHLDPLNKYGILCAIMFCFELGKIGNLFE